jgi:hypothetical protein
MTRIAGIGAPARDGNSGSAEYVACHPFRIGA